MKDISKMKNYREKYKRHYGIDFGKEYAIHHIDGNRENNEIENLLLLPMALHSKYHTYRDMFIAYAGSGICFDLTYSGSCLRGLQLSQLDDLRKVLNEIQEWIEAKYLADMGYAVYPKIKRRIDDGRR